MNKTTKLVYAAVFTALALIFGYIEHLIPIDFGIPGVKLGLANAAILPLLYIFDNKTAIAVQTGRILLSSLLFGSIMSLWYSLAGGFLSLTGMILLKKTDKLKAVSISTIGGVLHNVGQLSVAVIVLGTAKLWYYLPVLVLSGALTGVVIGFISGLIVRYFPQRLIHKNN